MAIAPGPLPAVVTRRANPVVACLMVAAPEAVELGGWVSCLGGCS
jgi:hypothetical protein